MKAFLDVVWQTLIWPSCFWGSPMVYILWWTLCIHSGEVFSWLLTLTHIHLPPGECSWSGQLLWRVFSSPGKEFFGHPPQLFSVVFRVFWCCWVNNALTQIHFNGTHFFNARLTQRVFSVTGRTRGPTRSWRNGDAQCCQLSNIADTFSDLFSLQKSTQT